MFLIEQKAYCQKFSLTPVGLKDSSNIENTFIVVTIDNKSAKELYSYSLRFIIKNYKSPNKVIQGQIENEYLKFETYVPKIGILEYGGIVSWDVSCLYTTELNFKDGKFKYEIVAIDLKYDKINELKIVGSTLTSYPIYNKKLQLIRPILKQKIEDYFYIQIKDITNFISENKSNDW